MGHRWAAGSRQLGWALPRGEQEASSVMSGAPTPHPTSACSAWHSTASPLLTCWVVLGQFPAHCGLRVSLCSGTCLVPFTLLCRLARGLALCRSVPGVDSDQAR